MELNGIVFPHPHPSYTAATYQSELVYIPRYKTKKQVKSVQYIDNSLPAIPNFKYSYEEHILHHRIPAIFIKSPLPTSKIIIYFHANAEDAGLSFPIMKGLQLFLPVHIIIMEYPGYGIYEGKTKPSKIIKDCEAAIIYIKMKLQWECRDIIVMGRSIGSFFALTLANKFTDLGGVILVSPFTNIRGMAKIQVGRILSYLIKERFDNVNLIKKITCPCLIISGLRDKIAPSHMAKCLERECRNCTLFQSEGMDHSHINIRKDLILPMKMFIRKYGIEISDDV